MEEYEIESKGDNPSKTHEGTQYLLMELMKAISDVGPNIITSYKLEMTFIDKDMNEEMISIEPIDPYKR